MTNSPPSNVKTFQSGDARVLASGIDSLTVSVQVEWKSKRFFELLSGLKVLAKTASKDEPARLVLDTASGDWLFTVKPHGKDGYEWILSGAEYGVRVGNWMRPQQRPSVMVDVRSETLWLLGPDASIARFLEFVTFLGGEVVSVNPSRVDLCVDLLLDRRYWTRDLEEHFVSRADLVTPHIRRRKLTGFSIGQDNVRARLYDKALEIATKSRKFWMYDIWKLEEVPEGYIALRVEFQFRRERLKQLGCVSWENLHEFLPGLWVYATSSWLRIVDDASLHHTQQTVVSWWEVVSGGFTGAQDASPLVRVHTANVALRYYTYQILGGLASVVALLQGDEVIDLDFPLDRDSHVRDALELLLRVEKWSDEKFTKIVQRKQAHFARGRPKQIGHSQSHAGHDSVASPNL